MCNVKITEHEITPFLSEIVGLLCAEGSHITSFSSYWGNDRGKKRFFKNDRSERIEVYNKDSRVLKGLQSLLLLECNYKTNITAYNKIHICKKTVIQKILHETPLGHTRWKIPSSVINGSQTIKASFIKGLLMEMAQFEER